MKKTLLIVFLITGLLPVGFSQIHQEGEAVAEQYQFTDKTPFVLLDQTVDEAFYPESEISGPTALYAGYIIPFQKEEMGRGIWETVKAGTHTWRIGISRENAKALNVYFQDVALRNNEQLFIYNVDRTVVLGAFTNMNNGKYLATEFIYDNEIVVEFSTQYTERVIPFGIRGIGVSVLANSSRDFGDADFCEILVNCPEGADWQNEKRGVTRILVAEGTKLYWCTGALVNNANLDATPYMLTANHCGENSSLTDYANWVFDFQYESNDCEMPSSEPISKSLSGSTLIAHAKSSTNAGSDFKLVLLNDAIPEDYNPYFNGWNRNGENSPSGVTIHHPEGDLQMISTYTDALVSTNYLNPTPDPNGKYWEVRWTETVSGFGVTEPGSSGSPIFDPAGNIVGLLSGGRADCINNDRPDYYGKFSYSWASNGADPGNQLQPWLDPENSGIEILKGTNLDTTGVKEYISVLTKLAPNPSTGKFNIIFREPVPDDIDILVLDAFGKQADFIFISSEGKTITLDLGQNVAGLYLIRIKTDGQAVILKALLYK